MKIYCRIFVFALDWKSGEKFFLSTTEDKVEPPSRLVGNKQPNEVAEGLYEEFCGLSGTWAGLKIHQAKILDGNLYIDYKSDVPMGSDLIKGHLINRERLDEIKKQRERSSNE